MKTQVTKLCDLGIDETVCSVGWSQQGTTLAVGTSNGEVQVNVILILFNLYYIKSTFFTKCNQVCEFRYGMCLDARKLEPWKDTDHVLEPWLGIHPCYLQEAVIKVFFNGTHV